MKQLFTIFVAILTTITCYSQPSLTSALLPEPNDFFIFQPSDTGLVSPGAAGANQSWDFSGLSVHYNPQSTQYWNPTATSYGGDFPSATVAKEDLSIQGEYIFMENSATELKILGNASAQRSLVYTDQHTLFTFPFTYNSSITDNFAGTVTYMSLTLNRAGNTSISGDGYGTLILPNNTFTNILRVKTVEHYTDEYVGQLVRTFDIIKHEWYDGIHKMPLLFIEEVASKMDTSAQPTLKKVFLSSYAAGINSPVINNEINIYPNPVEDICHLSFVLTEKTNMKISVINLMGQKLIEYPEKIYMSGIYNENLNLENLAKGTYFLQIKSNEKTIQKKLLLQ